MMIKGRGGKIKGRGVYIKRYAKYLRDKTDENALRAVHQFTNECNDLTIEEMSLPLAKEVLDGKPGGYFGYHLWQEKKTAYNAKIAFTILAREGEEIPQDLLSAILSELDSQIDHYEIEHPYVNTVVTSTSSYHRLRHALNNRAGTKVDVFKKYAEENGTDWEKLQDAYNKWEKRKVMD